VLKTRESTTTKGIRAFVGPCDLLVSWGEVRHWGIGRKREDRERMWGR